MSEILFLAHRAPWPPDRGDRIRSFHLLKALAALAPVHLAAFGEDQPPASIAPLLASHCIVRRPRIPALRSASALIRGEPLSLAAFDSSRLRRFVARTLANRPVGCVYAFSSAMAQFVPVDTKARFVMDFVDVDSAKFARYAADRRGPMRLIHAREARRLAVHDAAAARRASVSLFVSEAEASVFRGITAAGSVEVLGNGVDLGFFDPARVMPIDRRGDLIVFTGQMDYRPNVEAVTGFARLVLPLIRAERPEARFAVVGRDAGREVLALARLPGVTVTGAVADVRPWLAAASVVVAPLAHARGVQNKVLEAMAMARPVVASSAAAEGIDAAPGRDVVVADSPRAQADAVLALLDNEPRARTLGAAARARMSACYSWDARLARLGELTGLSSSVRAAA